MNNLKSIDQRLYGYLQAFYMSWYSGALYVDVAKRWKGFGILYFFLVFAVALIPISVQGMLSMRAYFDDTLMYPLSQMPTLLIKNGQVQFSKPMPYFIKNKSKQISIIIDTSGEIAQIPIKYPDLLMLVTKNTIYFRMPGLPMLKNKLFVMDEPATSTYALNQTNDGEFNPQTWIKQSPVLHLKWLLVSLVYPALLGSLYGLFLGFMFLFALMGQVVSGLIFKFKISFKQSARLMIVCSTPALISFFVLLGTYGVGKMKGFYFNILIILYFCFALLSVKRQSQSLVRF